MSDIQIFLDEYRNENKLRDYVIDYLEDEIISNAGNFGDLKNKLDEINQYGCANGTVSPLIYYDDTLKFYNEYQEEINDMLSENLESACCSIDEIFGDKFDKSDPLCLEQQNQNLLAWYGFEDMTYDLSNELEEELDKKVNEEEQQLDEEVEI